MPPLEQDLRKAEIEARNKVWIDENFASIQAHQFQKIAELRTEEYLEITQNLMELCPLPEQYKNALKYLKNGQATTAAEAHALLQAEEQERVGDAWPKRKK